MRVTKIGGTLVLITATFAAWAHSQTTLLLPSTVIQAIRNESTGELPMTHFRHIVTHYSGFAPSKGGDELAGYIAERMRSVRPRRRGDRGLSGRRAVVFLGVHH